MEPLRLGYREKVLVGAGSLAVFFGAYAIKGMGMPVYSITLGVDPALLGAMLALPRLWDAFIDPTVGNFSDNLRSRFERRRPLVFLGALAAAVIYGTVWMVSPAWSESVKAGWLLGTSLLFYTAYAIFSVPYQALTFEMSPDYDERTGIMGYCTAWYKIGSFGFDWLFWLTQLALFASPLAGVRFVNWTAAAVMMAGFGIVPAFFGRERYYSQAARQPSVRFGTALSAAFSSRALLILVALAGLNCLASMFASGMDLYVLIYCVSHGNVHDGAFWKGVLTSGYAVAGVASIPLLNAMSRRFGKKETMVFVSALGMIAGVGKWLVFRPGIGWWLLIDPVLSSPNLTAVTMVIPSMLADVCDDDEWRHGLRREGMFGALFLWIQKTGYAVSFLGAGIALDLAGFHAKLGAAQSAHALLWMRLTLAGATIVPSFAAVFAALRYPITRGNAAETRARLEARRGAV